MAARWADKSVTDCVMVEAGDSAGEGEADGPAVDSAAIALTLNNPIRADKPQMDTGDTNQKPLFTKGNKGNGRTPEALECGAYSHRFHLSIITHEMKATRGRVALQKPRTVSDFRTFVRFVCFC
jgi:hypothetical protein